MSQLHSYLRMKDSLLSQYTFDNSLKVTIYFGHFNHKQNEQVNREVFGSSNSLAQIPQMAIKMLRMMVIVRNTENPVRFFYGFPLTILWNCPPCHAWTSSRAGKNPEKIKKSRREHVLCQRGGIRVLYEERVYIPYSYHFHHTRTNITYGIRTPRWCIVENGAEKWRGTGIQKLKFTLRK